MMQWILDIGMILITLAVIPQIWRTWKNRKNIKDIDFKFSFLTMLGNSFAITWGYLNGQISLLTLNAVYLIWSIMSILFMVENELYLRKILKPIEAKFNAQNKDERLDREG